MSLCVIPARGGSKRIPRKNIRDFCGHPMISWSINAAKKSNIFDKVIVSTDDNEIASVSSYYGAEIPFRRPPELANDYATTTEVVIHAINAMREQGFVFEEVCCLYATAPFVQAQDLKDSYNVLKQSKTNGFVFPATTFDFPIQRAIKIDSEGVCEPVNRHYCGKRSQDLEPRYHDAGQFYWASSNTWLSNTSIFEHGKPIVIPRWRVQDIDTEEDWKQAEFMYITMKDDIAHV